MASDATVLSPDDAAEFRSAVRRVMDAQQAMNDANVELEFEKLRLRRKYSLGTQDAINPKTGDIQRVPE